MKFFILFLLLILCSAGFYDKILKRGQKLNEILHYHPIECYHTKYLHGNPYIYFTIENNNVTFIGRSKLYNSDSDYMDKYKMRMSNSNSGLYLQISYDCIKCIYLPNNPNIIEDLYCAYLNLYKPSKNKNKYSNCNSDIMIDYINLDCW